MTVYLGWHRSTEVACQPIDLGAGAGEIPCPECGGTGDWPFHPEGLACVCVACKGTGRYLVSI